MTVMKTIEGGGDNGKWWGIESGGTIDKGGTTDSDWDNGQRWGNR